MSGQVQRRRPMNNAEKHIKEPFAHVVRRGQISWWNAALIRVIAIVAALIFGGLVSYLLIGVDPIKLYSTMIDGVFGTDRRIWKLAKDIALLLCISLAVTPAFKMRFWNIGAEGQTLISCLASVACIIYLGGKVPEWLLLILMLISALVAGAVWALIPAIFKAKWNTNETLFTLMMNYVATYLVAYFLLKWTPSGSSTIGMLEKGHLPKIGDNEYLLLIITVALLTVAVYIYLKYSKQGYEISVVGESENTAKYIGINVKKVIIRTMIISGALCGLAGFLIVGALDHSVTTTTVGGLGFTAIMVSWLGKFNPIAMVLTSFLIVFLENGSDRIVSIFESRGVNPAFPSIITGIILFFIIGCEFFINYKIVFRKKEANK